MKWHIICASIMVLFLRSFTTNLGFIKFVQDEFQSNSQKRNSMTIYQYALMQLILNILIALSVGKRCISTWTLLCPVPIWSFLTIIYLLHSKHFLYNPNPALSDYHIYICSIQSNFRIIPIWHFLTIISLLHSKHFPYNPNLSLSCYHLY